MKSILSKATLLTLILGLGVSFWLVNPTYAEEEKTEVAEGGTNISISPVSEIFQLSSNSNYEKSFQVTNNGDRNIDIEVYAAPYSYVYSEDSGLYQLGFNAENNFTQITRWIKFKDARGEWQKNPKYTIKANDTLTVEYKVSTPDNIPAGGQYAVLFAHTLTGVTATNGITTEASPGLVVYGRSTEGEVNISAEISDMEIEQSITENGSTRNNFYAAAKVKNSGNIDFNATGVFKVESILGGASYETDNGGVKLSVIPEAELTLTDEWENSPSFGIYKATWTVTAGQEEPQVMTKIIFVNPLPLILFVIMLLTIIIVWVTIVVRKRKERRSRLAA